MFRTLLLLVAALIAAADAAAINFGTRSAATRDHAFFVRFVPVSPSAYYPHELWRTDGTQEGTIRLIDAGSKDVRQRIALLAATDDLAFFVLENESARYALWRSDGTAAGTVALIEPTRNPLSSLVVSRTHAVWINGDHTNAPRDVWVSDGSRSGTRLLTRAAVGSLVEHDGAFFLSGTIDGRSGIYRIDPEVPAPQRVFDAGAGALPSTLVFLRGSLYFVLDGWLWRLGEGGAGVRIAALEGGPFTLRSSAVAGENRFYVIATSAVPAAQNVQWTTLWVSDGTPHGTSAVVLEPPFPYGQVDVAVVLGGDRLVLGSGAWPHDLAFSDGTAAGTKWLDGFTFNSSVPTVLNGSLYFRGWGPDSLAGSELWATDGTLEGTRLVHDVFPGGWSSYAVPLIVWRDRLVFGAERWTEGGDSLWLTDGTAGGLRRILNFAGRNAIAGKVAGPGGMSRAGLGVELWSVDDAYFYFATSVTTDSEGRYAFEHVADGKYLVRTRNDEGWIDQLHGAGECPPCLQASGRVIEVRDRAVVEGLDFALRAGSTIGGKVLDAAGAPVAGVPIEIHHASGIVRTIHSDATGRWSSGAGLPAGVYFARTNVASLPVERRKHNDRLYGGAACGKECDAKSGTPIVVGDGALTDLDFELPRRGIIRGRLTDRASGEGPSNVRVYAVAGTESIPTMTRAGEFEFHLTDGAWRIVVSSESGYHGQVYPDVPCPSSSLPERCNTLGTPIEIRSGDVKVADMTVQPGGARLEGRIVDAATGLPIAGAVVTGMRQNPSSAYETPMFIVSTGADGRYTTPCCLSASRISIAVRALDPYVPTLYPGVPCGSACTLPQRPEFFLDVGTSALVTAPDIAVQRGFRLRGTVTSQFDGGAVGGAPVRVRSVDGATDYGTFPTDRYGVFITTPFPAGEYAIGVAPTPSMPFRPSDRVVVTAGAATSDVPLTVPLKPVLQISVFDARTGKPVSGAAVAIDGARQSAPTDARGEFRLVLEKAATVTVSKDGYETAVIATGAVADNQPSIHVVRLHELSPVAGVVFDSRTGEPLGNVEIRVVQKDGRLVTGARTNARGRYVTLSGIDRSEHYVVASRWGSPYPTQMFPGVECAGPCNVPPAGATPVRGKSGELVTADFAMRSRDASVTVRLTDAETGLAVAGAGVEIFTVTGNGAVRSGVSDATGTVTLSVPLGVFHVKTFNDRGYVDVLRGGVVCGPRCDLSRGEPLVVAAADPIVVDISLPRTGISSVEPPSGSIAGGEEVVIRGGGFVEGQTIVFFGAARAEIVSVASDAIVARTPPYVIPGMVNVTVNRATLRTSFEYASDCATLSADASYAPLDSSAVLGRVHVQSSAPYTVRWYRTAPGSTSYVPIANGPDALITLDAGTTVFARVTGRCRMVDVPLVVPRRRASG